MTYYGKAVDSRNPANTVTTDIYFIEVRPFNREYRQGQQGGGGGGGGGGGEGESMEALLKRQKDIIAATHKLHQQQGQVQGQRVDRQHPCDRRESNQGAEQTNTLVERMSRRGLDESGQDDQADGGQPEERHRTDESGR